MTVLYCLAVKTWNGRLDPSMSLGVFTEDQLEQAWDKVNELMADDVFWYTDNYEWTVCELPWRQREQHRFEHKEYKPLPWVGERFWKNHHSVWKDHFPHVSKNDPTMLAYTESPEKGEADRQTIMRPGKYLTKFFGAGKDGCIAAGNCKYGQPILSPQEIAYYAEWFEKGQKPRRYAHLTLKFATTPKAIAEAYINGPRSCMRNNNSWSSWKQHPVQVYGAGDLQLAYLEDQAGQIRARALCWPEKQGFGRCYPAPEYWQTDGFSGSNDSQECQDELRLRLSEMGWADVYKKSDALEGARLLKVPVPPMEIGADNHYRMPYLDVNYRFDHHPDGEHFIMTRDGRYVGGTAGYSEVVPMFTCARCGGHFREVVRGIPQQVTVHGSWSKATGPADPEVWDTHCVSDYAYRCHGTGAYYKRGAVRRTLVEGNHYVAAWARQQEMYTCAHDGVKRFITETHKPVTLNGLTYSPANIHYTAFWCAYDKTLYLMHEMSSRWPGFPAKYDDHDISPEDRFRSDFTIQVRRFDKETGVLQTIRTPPFQGPIDHKQMGYAYRHWGQISQPAQVEPDVADVAPLLAAE